MLAQDSKFPELVCPIDKESLHQKDDILECANGHKWNIKQNIPHMIPESNNYADAFGLQWKTYRKTQLDSYTNTTISHDRLQAAFGKELWDKLNGPSKVSVLETGCGAGRFTEVLLNTKSAYVTSTDYSSAVEANEQNFPQNDRHRIIRANLLSSPFVSERFDIVMCIGVVQHTPDPEETIAKLYEQVKPGGWLIFDHYTYTLSRFTKTAVLIRPILKRLSPQRGLKITEALTKFFLPMHRAVRNVKILQQLLSRISPVLTYYHVFPQLNDELQYEWALLDTHDTLTDYYKHLRSKKQLRRTLTTMGSEKVYCEPGGNGVVARCQKPI